MLTSPWLCSGARLCFGRRVFWEPLCIPKNLNLGQRDRELKYIQAAANSVMAVVIVSKTTFFTRDIDVSKVSPASISLSGPIMQRAGERCSASAHESQ